MCQSLRTPVDSRCEQCNERSCPELGTLQLEVPGHCHRCGADEAGSRRSSLPRRSGGHWRRGDPHVSVSCSASKTITASLHDLSSTLDYLVCSIASDRSGVSEIASLAAVNALRTSRGARRRAI